MGGKATLSFWGGISEKGAGDAGKGAGACWWWVTFSQLNLKKKNRF